MACCACQSPTLVRRGRTRNGKQRYTCKTCKRHSREDPQPLSPYTEERKEEILRAYQERSSLCALKRIFGVERNTVSAWIKKCPQLASPGDYGAPPRRRGNAYARTLVVRPAKTLASVDLDRAGSGPTESRWICYGESHPQNVSTLVGVVAEVLSGLYCLYGFWKAYQKVIPEKQHHAVGKDRGETAPIERWNNTLRQRLACFVRDTLSFSKC